MLATVNTTFFLLLLFIIIIKISFFHEFEHALLLFFLCFVRAYVKLNQMPHNKMNI